MGYYFLDIQYITKVFLNFLIYSVFQPSLLWGRGSASQGPAQHSGPPTPGCAPASASCRKTAPSMPPSTLISSLALTFSVTAPDTRRGWRSTTRGWSWQKPTGRRRQATTSVALLRSWSYLLPTKFCCFICFLLCVYFLFLLIKIWIIIKISI